MLLSRYFKHFISGSDLNAFLKLCTPLSYIQDFRHLHKANKKVCVNKNGTEAKTTEHKSKKLSKEKRIANRLTKETSRLFSDLDSEPVMDINRKLSLANRLKLHTYNNIYNWKTAEDVAGLMYENKIYEDEMFLVLNKPYGVTINTTVANPLQFYGKPLAHEVQMGDVLPILKSLSNSSELIISYTPEKWNSGVMMLSKFRVVHHLVFKCTSFQAAAQQLSNRVHWGVTRYPPMPLQQSFTKRGMMLEHYNGTFVPVLTKPPSKSAVKRGKGSVFSVYHQTLSMSPSTQAALVEVGAQGTKHHCLRMWLVHCLAPVLGDKKYEMRVGKLLDKLVPVPYSRAPPTSPLEGDILKCLELNHAAQPLIPLHLHLRYIVLPNFWHTVERHCQQHSVSILNDCLDRYKGQTDPNKLRFISENAIENKEDIRKFMIADNLVFAAPLPEYFVWTLNKLGLEAPTR